MELNREQLIKALECCHTNSEMDCIDCPYRNKGNDIYGGCVNTLVEDALSLINELTQECKKWQHRMKIECEHTKADTVRKMQSELKKTFSALCKGEMGDLYRIIDQIAKEMEESVDEG